jgi:hypothetical protein
MMLGLAIVVVSALLAAGLCWWVDNWAAFLGLWLSCLLLLWIAVGLLPGALGWLL